MRAAQASERARALRALALDLLGQPALGAQVGGHLGAAHGRAPRRGLGRPRSAIPNADGRLGGLLCRGGGAGGVSRAPRAPRPAAAIACPAALERLAGLHLAGGRGLGGGDELFTAVRCSRTRSWPPETAWRSSPVAPISTRPARVTAIPPKPVRAGSRAMATTQAPRQQALGQASRARLGPSRATARAARGAGGPAAPAPVGANSAISATARRPTRRRACARPRHRSSTTPRLRRGPRAAATASS